MSALQSPVVELDTFSQAGPEVDLTLSLAAPVPADSRRGEAAEPTSSLESSSTSISSSAGSVAPGRGSRRTATLRERCRDVLGSTLTANALVIPGLFIAAVGFAWMVLTQRYTVRNDRLQDCLNYRQAGIITDVCEDTIAAGIPSFWRKRDNEATNKEDTLLREILWLRRVLALVLTVAVGISTIVWFRPKVVLFPPVTSIVRSQPSASHVAYHTFVSRECRRCRKVLSRGSSLAEGRRSSVASTDSDLGSRSRSNPSKLSFEGEDAGLEELGAEGDDEEEDDGKGDFSRLSRAPKCFKQDDVPEAMPAVRTLSPDMEARLQRMSIAPSVSTDSDCDSIPSLHLPSLFLQGEDENSENETPDEEQDIEQEDILKVPGSLTANMTKTKDGIPENAALRALDDAVIAVHPLLLAYYYKLSNVRSLRGGLLDFEADYAQARTVRNLREDQGLPLTQSLGQFEEEWERERVRVKQTLMKTMAVVDAAHNACLEAGLDPMVGEAYHRFLNCHTSGKSAYDEFGAKKKDDAHPCLADGLLKTRSDALQQEIHQPSQDYAVSTMLESQGFIPSSPTLQEDGEYRCEKCRVILEEDIACENSGYRWHHHCFRCSACGTLLDPVANHLLLFDGSLVCNDCTHKCSACGNTIMDHAILTADQTYCISCFRCRKCKRTIETRYFRTSQGNFCMECHKYLRAKRERNSQKNPTSKARPSGIGETPAFDQSQPVKVVSRGRIPIHRFEELMDDSKAPGEPSLPLVAGVEPEPSSVVGSSQEDQDMDNTTRPDSDSNAPMNQQLNDQDLAFNDELEASKSSRASTGLSGSLVPPIQSTATVLASKLVPPNMRFSPISQTRRRAFDVRSWWSKRAEA